VPVSVAILSAWLLSLYGTLVQADHVYFDSVCMFTFFLLTGRFLELNSRHRYQQAESLSDSLLPDVVRLVNLSGKESLVALENVRQGDRIRVSSGEVIGADGCVLEGVSHIDEAAFTGESLPVLRRPGQAVFAGGKNLDVDILVEVAGEKSSWVISRISESFREAVNYKPAFSVLADRVARYFVTGVLGLAFISGFFWYLSGAENWFVVSLTVLVVSCPCALSLATPIAYTLAAAVLRNAGVVLSNGAFLERLTEVNTVVFDKTGTLTTGEMALAETRVLGGASGENLIEIASVLEKGSLHPVARAFGTVGDLTVSERASVPGEGVAGVIGGRRYRLGSPLFAAGEALQLPDESHYWILLGSEKPLCWFGFHDRLRAEAGTVIDSLNNLGMENLLYTGDASARVEKLAREAGVEGYKKGLSPEEKMSAIMSLQKDGKKILMVGDGVNDTGAMRVADASISVSPVDAFVQSSADATLLGGNLDAIPMLIRYAGRVRRVIRQNIIWALVYNFSVIPLAVVGILQPWMAALGMSLSSLLVVLNANRVYRLK
ncbi:MAG: heavy metal translocating P-type ATPase, partial [Gammaproteobacteria bacterium]|nr:heavy metal translocating P-type ATPase [Gammaproteobacteria bacterium]